MDRYNNNDILHIPYGSGNQRLEIKGYIEVLAWGLNMTRASLLGRQPKIEQIRLSFLHRLNTQGLIGRVNYLFLVLSMGMLNSIRPAPNIML